LTAPNLSADFRTQADLGSLNAGTIFKIRPPIISFFFAGSWCVFSRRLHYCGWTCAKMRNILSFADVLPGVSPSRKGRNPMHKFVALSNVLLLLPLLALFVAQADAQKVPALEGIKSQEELNKTVASLDEALFDSYNSCDLEKFAAFFADYVEFYHDQGGVTLGRQELTNSIKNNICGKVTRELVPGTLQVYHMKGY